MNIYDIVFYLFAAITVLSAFFVVTTRNIVYSAYYLLFTFFGVAGIYVLLGADFIAMVQLIVYVGGILILILFGVMLTNKITSVEIKTGSVQVVPAAVGVALLAGILMASMVNTKWRSVETAMPSATTQGIGMLLIQQYAIVFELLGILLLIALIGAASMARK
ncbi:MAG: NADH-quinone oxidoreductase subunit J family protein [Ignavibacteriaceae bacterium]